MKQDLEEKRINRLFYELRQDDEQHAPSFDSVLKAESSKAGPARLSLRIAVAATMLILVGALVFIFLIRSSMPPTETESPQLAHPTVKPLYQPEPPPHAPPTPSVERASALEAIRRGSARPARPTRPAPRYHRPAMLISQWQSPTDFLLRTPGDRLLKTVPRVGESLIEIKPITPDEMN